jgi:hypothetical protein
VYFDPELNFKFHTSQLSNKLSKTLYSLRLVKNILPKKSLLSLYYSIFHSHLVYTVEIWGSASTQSINTIAKKQKQAIRLISGSKYNAHTQPIFKNLEILPLTQLITFFNLKFMHSFIYKSIPKAFHETWITNAQYRAQINLNLDQRAMRNDEDIFIPPFRTDFIGRKPYFNLPKLWNNITEPSLKYQPNKVSFNIGLKKSLINVLNDNYVCNRLLCPHCHLFQ